jgi:flagellar biosynthesis protein FlhF
MNVKTYRAKTMQEALALVRDELGAKASVLRTRELPARGLSRLWGSPGVVEVVASDNVSVPSRLPTRQPVIEPLAVPTTHSGIDLSAAEARALPDAVLLKLARDLTANEVPEVAVHELMERLRKDPARVAGHDLTSLKRRHVDLLAAEISVAGPIRLMRGRRHLVALVGPTGVGKTTTLAKLAAHFRLRENVRVGLVTVDTYRIAAVEQLRSYAEIIALPLEVADSPAAIQQATAKLSEVDLVLMDTAGCSPRDEVRIQQLKQQLAAAGAHEVHLVLSSVSSPTSLACSIDAFAAIGVTTLMLTKVDEAAALGSLLPILHRGRLPLSYLTHGQGVPDDIAAADGAGLAAAILGLRSLPVHQ